jgi:hypothetical protein
MLKKEEIFEMAGQLLIEARNSGIGTYQDIKNKDWIPKNPNTQEQDAIELVNNLSKEQASKIENVIGYLIDLSFFKLMDLLENGYRDINFNLSVINEDKEFPIIGENSEINISHEYWIWLSKYGIKGTTPW